MAGAERHVRRPSHAWALALVLLGACGDELGHVRVMDVTLPSALATEPEPSIEITAQSVRLLDGIAVQVRIEIIGDDGESMDDVELKSTDPSVFDVTPSFRKNLYVLFGRAPGNAKLAIHSEGRKVGTRPVTVDPQRP